MEINETWLYKYKVMIINRIKKLILNDIHINQQLGGLNIYMTKIKCIHYISHIKHTGEQKYFPQNKTLRSIQQERKNVGVHEDWILVQYNQFRKCTNSIYWHHLHFLSLPWSTGWLFHLLMSVILLPTPFSKHACKKQYM